VFSILPLNPSRVHQLCENMAYNDTPPVYAGEQKDSPRGLVDQPQLTYAEFLVSPLAKAFDEQFPTWLPRNSNSADEPEQQAETEDKAASTGPSMFGPPLVSIEEARPSQERSTNDCGWRARSCRQQIPILQREWQSGLVLLLHAVQNSFERILAIRMLSRLSRFSALLLAGLLVRYHLGNWTLYSVLNSQCHCIRAGTLAFCRQG
jgi:hypothetical protein